MTILVAPLGVAETVGVGVDVDVGVHLLQLEFVSHPQLQFSLPPHLQLSLLPHPQLQLSLLSNGIISEESKTPKPPRSRPSFSASRTGISKFREANKLCFFCIVNCFVSNTCELYEFFLLCIIINSSSRFFIYSSLSRSLI